MPRPNPASGLPKRRLTTAELPHFPFVWRPLLQFRFIGEKQKTISFWLPRNQYTQSLFESGWADLVHKNGNWGLRLNEAEGDQRRPHGNPGVNN